jgi:thymidylate synthase (FAD)
MKFVEPSFDIISVSGTIQDLEAVARTCYRSEDRIKEGSAETMVKNLIKNNHTAMLEFIDISVRMVTDRGVSHELVRHRIASYAQESTRYVSYEDGVEFIKPLFIEKGSLSEIAFERGCLEAEQMYGALMLLGAKPQDARAVLPMCLATTLVMKTNLRSWRNFFQLRTDKAAHPEMRRIAIPMLRAFQDRLPIVFDDI